MHDLCSYRILLAGAVDKADVNALSPLQAAVEPLDAGATLLTVRTDQAGLVGLIRHLHGLGFILLSAERSR